MAKAGKKQLCTGTDFDDAAEKWNANLRSCMGGMHLGVFAEKLNKKFGYKTSFTQPLITQWRSVGRNQMFPRYEIMIKMADILDVSVSRLTGETPFDSMPAQITSEHTGLSNEAIRSLRQITMSFGSPFASKYLRNKEFDEDAVQLINAMLTSDGFLEMLVAMKQLSDAVQRSALERDEALSLIEEEHGSAAFKKAMVFATGTGFVPIEPDETIDDYWANNKAALIEADICKDELHSLFVIAGQIETAIDATRIKDNEAEMLELACRHQVRLAFDKLLEEMFPSGRQSNYEE